MALLSKLSGCQNRHEDDEITSIVANINHVLSTTRGYGFFLHDFGVSDYRYLGTRDDIAEAISAEITENIAHFEPRVILKTIETADETKLARLSFLIECEVRSTGQRLKLYLEPVSKRYQISHD